MLASLSPQRRLAYLPEYFHVLLTAGVLDDALFDEAADWGSCAVMMKPRTRVDSLWTMLQAGLISLMWNVKLGGVKVGAGCFSERVGFRQYIYLVPPDIYLLPNPNALTKSAFFSVEDELHDQRTYLLLAHSPDPSY